MDNVYYQKLRVFWHELGHFIAQYYNHLYFHGEGTDQLRITRQETMNQRTDYCGGTLLKNYDREAVLKHPASLIGSAAYGCYFQCIKYGNAFESCFAPEHTGGHGFTDFEQVNRVILQFTDNPAVNKQIMQALKEHFLAIQQKSEFRQLFTVEVDDLIASDEPELWVNLEELHQRFDFFIPLHKESYMALIDRLKAILQPCM